MRNLKRISTALTAAFLAFVSGGCSLTLVSITALDEARSKQEARVELNGLDEIIPGSPVRVYMTSGETEKGRFGEMLFLPEGQAFSLEQEHGGRVILLTDVARLERQRKGHSLWPALVLGGLIDVAYLVALITFEPRVDIKF